MEGASSTQPGLREMTRGNSNLSRGDYSRHYVGVTMVLSVAVIWVASSEFIQYIFGDFDFNKPLFLTYFNTGLFSVYLIKYLFRRSVWEWVWRNIQTLKEESDGIVEEYDELLDGTEDLPQSFKSNGPREDNMFDLQEVLKKALLFGPIWFIANYLFNLGLQMTSVASSSTLSTASGLFTFLIGVSLKIESFNYLKVLSVLLNILGVALISFDDVHDVMHEHSFRGDLAALMSALGYGVYTTFLKIKLEDDNRVDMLLFFGLVGLTNLITTWPILYIFDAIGIEKFAIPSTKVLTLLVCNGMIGTVLSDYLWARSVLLTTPLIATLATSLSIPLSLVADTVLHGSVFTWVYFTGTFLVVSGFVASNIAERK